MSLRHLSGHCDPSMTSSVWLLSNRFPWRSRWASAQRFRQVLEKWIAPGALEAIYVNHPEPPQQTASSNSTASATTDPEAAHMLDERTLNAAAVTLLPGGTLTIVTDNLWFVTDNPP